MGSTPNPSQDDRADRGGAAADARLRQVLEAIGDLFYVVDRDDRFELVSRRALEAWGKREDEVLGRRTPEVFPEIVKGESYRLTNEIRATGRPIRAEIVSMTLDGRWIEFEGYPTEDGGVAIAFRDISERKRAEQTLREAEQRLRQLFAQSPLGNAVAGPDMHLREVNPALCRMLGYEAAELIGRSFLDVVHPDDRAECMRQGQRLLSGAAERLQIEERFLRKSGEPIWVSVNVGPVCDDKGTLLYALGVIENIDERRRLAQAIRDSEQRLRLTTESAEIGLWELDLDTGLFTWSERYREMLGIGPDAVPSRATFEAAVDPADLPRIYAERQRTGTDGDRYQVEYRTRDKSGGIDHWILSHGRVFFADDGRPIRIIGASLDITQRKRAERELRDAALLLERRIVERTRELAEANRRLQASEESQRALFRRAPVPMHALDTAHRIVDVSDAWLDVFGYRREEVVGRSITEFHHDGSEPDYEERWARVLATGWLREAERRYVKKSGAVLEALLSAVAQRDAQGQVERVISVVTDISARRRAEAAARREREFSDLLVDTSTQGIVAIDTGLRHTVWNVGIETMTGIPRRQVLGRGVFEMFPQIAGSPVEAAWRAALDGRATVLSRRVFSVPETGRHGFYEGSFSPVRGPGGAIIGAIAFISDATERYRMEEQLRQAQKMEALGQITGGVAHDFNNLLTVINGNVELLRHKLGDGGGERQIAAIERAARRGENLTRQLLSFSRRQTLHPKRIELRNRLLKLLELVRPSLRGDIELAAEVAPDTWSVEVDPGELELALLNIATNARDAMPKGGQLRLASRNRTLYDGGEQGAGALTGDFVEIAVSDTGTGIPEQVLPRIFEPFFTTKEVGKGTGLGLSQVYGFARESGGAVEVESSAGAGTTIRLLLPRAGAEPSGTPLAATPPAAAASGRILLVEDNDEVAEITVAILEESGYRVSRAAAAEQALGMLDAGEAVDLVLSDIIMPGPSNGLDLARLLRRRFPALPVLLTTGYSTAAKEAAAEGFVILRKPYDRDTIHRTIRDALSREVGG